MLIGIDLLWVRPCICGGTEAMARNLINGFGKYDDYNEYLLFVGRDVVSYFSEFTKYQNIRISVCNTASLHRIRRIAWENAFLDMKARKEGINLMFVPVYSKPNSKAYNKGGIPYVTVIHDLQAVHFPEYFSKAKRIFAKRSWAKACRDSVCIITGSNFCKEDIIERYPIAKEKIKVIHDPVSITSDCDDAQKKILFNELSDKYHISEDGYFYTVSSMLPHKNLDTILRFMRDIKDKSEWRNIKLLVSGVGGNKDEFNKKVNEYHIEGMVIDTGFVSDKERDILYKNCLLFLFPSEFEGFGMPPIEAMLNGARVVASKHPCIEEVTKGKAVYVGDARDTKEWQSAIEKALSNPKKQIVINEYSVENASMEYINVFNQFIKRERELGKTF